MAGEKFSFKRDSSIGIYDKVGDRSDSLLLSLKKNLFDSGGVHNELLTIGVISGDYIIGVYFFDSN